MMGIIPKDILDRSDWRTVEILAKAEMDAYDVLPKNDRQRLKDSAIPLINVTRVLRKMGYGLK
jgi:hypothetical protein